MTKKLLVTLCLLGLGVVSMVGCGKDNSTETTKVEKETTTESKDVETEVTTETESEVQKEVITTGTLISYSEETDSSGNKEALFKDVHGLEFVAIISEDTEMDNLEVGKEYEVYHTDMQTNSLPGKFPQVSKIVAK